MSWLSDPQIWASLITLTALEIVLGIDNIVFIAILASRLPGNRRARARRVGLALALISRLALLVAIVWIVGLTRPLFEVLDRAISWRDIILIAGGQFLLLESIITAVGMANSLWVMAAAVIIAVGIMFAASGPLSLFIERHPTVRMLALSFLLLIGMTLIADGAGFHVPKGYVYTAIVFSISVELLNQLAARRRRRHGTGDRGLWQPGHEP